MICNSFSTNNQTSIDNHIARVHEGKKSHLCTKCGSRFSTKVILRRHISCVHENDFRPHHCSICGKDFKLKQHLKEPSESVHEDKKQFECEKCDCNGLKI